MFKSLFKMFPFLVTASALFVAGCSSLNQVTEPVNAGKGVAMLKIVAAAGGPFQKIAKKASITVSASDMITMTKSLSITDSSVEGVVSGIPAGKNRLFAVAVYDSLDTLQYSGSTVATVIADTTVNIFINVIRVAGGAVINGNIIESTNLMAYYPFNGNAKDESGNLNNGTIGTAVAATDRFGIPQKALAFSGDTIGITVSAPSLKSIFQDSSSFTIAFWFKTSYNESGAWLMGKHIPGYANGFLVMVNQSSNYCSGPGYISFYTSPKFGNSACSNTSLNDGRWHFAVCEYIPSTSASHLYIDGSSTPYTGKRDSTLNNAADLKIGVSFHGSLDDIRIYNRALSSTERAALYKESGWPGIAPLGMKYLPGGTFQMGQTGISDPVHAVTVSGLYIDTTLVTQADYVALMGVNPSGFPGDLQRPVENVTWYDAVLYCNKRSKRDGKDTVYSFTSVTGTPGNGCTGLTGITITYAKKGYRLPTDAEWEYACKAGTTTAYFWGADTVGINNYAWWIGNSAGTTHPVATKLPNPWGLYDMTGNLWEHCNDYYALMTSGAQTNPTGPATGTSRILRGGPWAETPNHLYSAYRTYIALGSRNNSDGFRCVCSVQ